MKRRLSLVSFKRRNMFHWYINILLLLLWIVIYYFYTYQNRSFFPWKQQNFLSQQMESEKNCFFKWIDLSKIHSKFSFCSKLGRNHWIRLSDNSRSFENVSDQPEINFISMLTNHSSNYLWKRNSNYNRNLAQKQTFSRCANGFSPPSAKFIKHTHFLSINTCIGTQSVRSEALLPFSYRKCVVSGLWDLSFGSLSSKHNFYKVFCF